MVYFGEMRNLVVKIGHLTKWMIFFAIEQVFRRPFCVFWTVFKFLKLFVLINGVNSTILLFSRIRQISVDVLLCQNTQNIITFMVRFRSENWFWKLFRIFVVTKKTNWHKKFHFPFLSNKSFKFFLHIWNKSHFLLFKCLFYGTYNLLGDQLVHCFWAHVEKF